MQERYEVARVKTDSLDRREINSMKGSKNYRLLQNVERFLALTISRRVMVDKRLRQEPQCHTLAAMD